jgi:WD40 repeat protein
VIERINHPTSIRYIKWHPTQSIIASESLDNAVGTGGNLVIYDLGKTQAIYSEPSILGLAVDIIWMPTNQLLAWGPDAGLFTIEAATGAVKKLFPSASDHPGGFIIGQLSPDGRYLAFVDRESANKGVFFFDLTTASIVKKLPYSENLTPLEWSPDGTKLATVADDDTQIIWGSD